MSATVFYETHRSHTCKSYFKTAVENDPNSHLFPLPYFLVCIKYLKDSVKCFSTKYASTYGFYPRTFNMH